MISFKRAEKNEINFIQNIAETTWPLTYEPLLGKEQVTYMLAILYSTEALQTQFDEGHFFYFVYVNDSLAGFSSFGKIENDTWKLYKLYLLPHQQGSGAGKAMMDFVLKKIISLDGRKLILNVNRFNKARFFYEKSGFKIIKDIDINIGNDYFMNDYVMELELTKID